MSLNCSTVGWPGAVAVFSSILANVTRPLNFFVKILVINPGSSIQNAIIPRLGVVLQIEDIETIVDMMSRIDQLRYRAGKYVGNLPVMFGDVLEFRLEVMVRQNQPRIPVPVESASEILLPIATDMKILIFDVYEFRPRPNRRGKNVRSQIIRMTQSPALLIIPAGNDNRQIRRKLSGRVDNLQGKVNGQMHKVISAQFEQFRARRQQRPLSAPRLPAMLLAAIGTAKYVI